LPSGRPRRPRGAGEHDPEVPLLCVPQREHHRHRLRVAFGMWGSMIQSAILTPDNEVVTAFTVLGKVAFGHYF
jgi:hypothetical protein